MAGLLYFSETLLLLVKETFAETNISTFFEGMDAGHGHGDAGHGAGEHHHGYRLASLFETAVEGINSFAGIVVLTTVLLAVINCAILAMNGMMKTKFNLYDPFLSHSHSHGAPSILLIRLMLGQHIALALSLLVAADILDTVLKPAHSYAMADITKMGIIAVVRTGLAYFLGKEMQELEEEMHHAKEHSSGHHADDASDSGHHAATTTPSPATGVHNPTPDAKKKKKN